MGEEGILVDSMVIIEAHRIGCWNAIQSRYQLETVEKCAQEVATGNSDRADYVKVEDALLRKTVTVNQVNQDELIAFDLKLEDPVILDDGEKHLLAHALTRKEACSICCSDRAAIRAAHRLGLLDQFVSLEKLSLGAGCRRPLKPHFTEKWLLKIRTQLFLGEN